MKISVIIPTHNRALLLAETLDALCRQTASKDSYEVIVVNDGSTDSTDSVVEELSERLSIQYYKQPRSGVSTARNLGIRVASSPLILLLDDDVVPSQRLIEEHVEFHTRTPGSEGALLGYVTWHPRVSVTPFMRWYGEYGALFGYSMLKNNREAPAKFLYTCNVSFKTEFLLSCGGFNETLTVFEDHELGYRLTKGGMKLIFCKSALGYHNQTFTFAQACERLRRYSVGLKAFAKTEAGENMILQREKLWFRMGEGAIKILAPALSPFLFVLDTNIRLPNSIYRLFYIYYGTYRSFWSHDSSKESRA
jgi:glycosyltransferase involved in cell wall biosynthesis